MRLTYHASTLSNPFLKCYNGGKGRFGIAAHSASESVLPSHHVQDTATHMITITQRASSYVAFIAALVAMLGSLYFSEITGFIPCTLCWYQRILMYPLTVILLVGILRKDRGIYYYVLPFSLLGIFVSTYHYLIQKTDLFSNTNACTTGIPCSTTWINWFGFVTIPFLALIAFLTITIMMLVFLTGQDGGEQDANGD